MEKTISKEQYNQIKIGDKIKLISTRPTKYTDVRCCWHTKMDGMAGQILPVYEVIQRTPEFNEDPNISVNIKVLFNGDTYYISEDMITEVNPKEEQSETFIDLIAKTFEALAGYKKEDMKFTKVIDKVIYNKPATIILWADGTKTTAKCADNEPFDPEKGLILCALKKFVRTEDVMELLDFVKTDGNGTVTYKDVLNKSREKKKAKTKIITVDVGDKSMSEVKEELKAIKEAEKKKSK